MFIRCGWGREDCDLGVFVAWRNLVPPVATINDVIVNEEIVITDDFMQRVKRILRIFNLLFGDTIMSAYKPANTFAVEGIAKEKRIVARKIGSCCNLFETKREGCILKEGGATKTYIHMFLVKISRGPKRRPLFNRVRMEKIVRNVKMTMWVFHLVRCRIFKTEMVSRTIII